MVRAALQFCVSYIFRIFRLACWVDDHYRTLLPTEHSVFLFRSVILSEKGSLLGMIVQLCKSCGFHGLHLAFSIDCSYHTPFFLNKHEQFECKPPWFTQQAVMSLIKLRGPNIDYVRGWRPNFLTCDLGQLDNKNCFDCLWWRTWHQHLGQPYLRNLDIISTYMFIFLLFCCFDIILMSSIPSLAQPFIISIFIMQGFWLIIMINLWWVC